MEILIEFMHSWLVWQYADRDKIFPDFELNRIYDGLDDAAAPDVCPKRRVEIAIQLIIVMRVVGVEIHNGFEVANAIESNSKAAGIEGQLGKKTFVGDTQFHWVAKPESARIPAITIKKCDIENSILRGGKAIPSGTGPSRLQVPDGQLTVLN